MLRKVSQTKIDEIAASLAQQKADLEKEQSAKPSAPATNGSNFLKNAVKVLKRHACHWKYDIRS